MINIDSRNSSFDISPGTLQQHETFCPQIFLTDSVDMLKDSDNLLGDENSLVSHEKLFSEGIATGSGSVYETQFSDSFHESNSRSHSISSDAFFHSTVWDVAHFPDDYSHGESVRSGQKTKYWHFSDSQQKVNYDYNIVSNSSVQHNSNSTCASTMLDFIDNDVSDCKDYIDTSADISKHLQGHITNEEFSLGNSDRSICETEWLRLDLHSSGRTSDDKHESPENQLRCQDRKLGERCKRSQSAPPFYKHKTRFISLSCHHYMMKEGNAQLSSKSPISPGTDELKHLNLQPKFAKDLTSWPSPMGKDEQRTTLDAKQKRKEIDELKHLDLQQKYANDIIFSPSPLVKNEKGNILDIEENKKGFLPTEIQESTDSGTKWRNGCELIAEKHEFGSVHDILNISSGFLHLAGNSLAPQSINKKCLEDARVLHQVDKKFIPIVASGTLALIDQHAADERIQLEELRQKVLSGEAKTVSYLDTEKELILPEIGHQLIQTYAGQIREWGWICDIQAQHSDSFKKNLNILHQEPAVVTLVAVPCILGVNLSDGDLLEFLEQLADTDGSSTIPPSVLRVLNSKACRGAIMFGDSLLPSECALIVEELKQTSLCFQCAHGRPTTVPLLNLEELHHQIAKLRLLDGSSSKVWHGLHRQELSLERAARRLNVARS